MPEPTVNVTKPADQPGALYIEFDNQPAMNAFTPDMWRKLIGALRDARRDDSVHAVILTGAGDRAFSSGLSMDELNKMTCDDDYAVFYNLGLEVRESIFALGKPIIAAVRGNCVGGGFEIALCCDLIYAAEGSKFMLPEINIGLVPGCGGAINLAAKMPMNRAMEMILFSERITAEEAMRWGVVNKVFPAESFDADLRKCVDKLISKPPLAVAGLKQLLSHTSTTADERESLKVERRLSIDLMNTHDFKEAVTAFREKRPPVFKGE